MGKWTARLHGATGQIADKTDETPLSTPVSSVLSVDQRNSGAEIGDSWGIAPVAEMNGWRRNPDGPGWVETPERAARCAFNDGPLAEGNPALCAACYARILGEDGEHS